MSDMQNDATAQTKFSRSEQKRQTILQSAEELFLTRGFNGTSMDEVADHAGVSKQTVYHQNANKASLFVEVVQSMTAQGARRVQVEVREPKNLPQVATDLSGHAERLLTIVMTPKLLRLRRLVIAEADRFPELGRALYDGGPDRAIAGLAVHLKRWADRDLLSISDARVAATQFNWLVMGDPVNQAMFRADYVMSKTERLRHIEHAVRVFIAAYEYKTKRATMNRKLKIPSPRPGFH
jgi:TetR/AcrR family transcriptional repressor of mexJK operon